VCPVLGDLDNGKIRCLLGKDGTPTEGDTCVYVCDDGIVMTGNVVRRCQNDGTWSGSEPTCERGQYIMIMCVV